MKTTGLASWVDEQVLGNKLYIWFSANGYAEGIRDAHLVRSLKLLGAIKTNLTMNRIFISHTSEDKEAIARPLTIALQEKGFDVWYDEFTLTLGDNLTKSIDLGLASCDFGVVI